MSVLSSFEWEQFLKHHPDAHILQSSRWGEFKSSFGWKALHVQNGSSGAQILFRNLPLGFSIAYIPKGPVGLINEEIIKEINFLSIKNKAIVIYIEPDCFEGETDIQEFQSLGFDLSNISIQPRRTILVSLKGSDAERLEGMKQKTRYNIHLAQKKGITVCNSSDIEAFIELMRETGERNQFGIHNADYYRQVHQVFTQDQSCELLIAKYQTAPVAALLLFMQGKRAWYFYGASSDVERNRMPTYLLQWEAMRLAAARGCTVYDLWGIPDYDEHVLEEKFISRDDGLWGVYRFKRGFGGKVMRSAGVFQRILNPLAFQIYQKAYQLRKTSIA